MNVKIEQSWKEVLQREFEQDYFCNLVAFVKQEYASGTVFPPGNEIFAAFDATPFDRVKVVIIGQDPYHGEGQANGLCFSVADVEHVLVITSFTPAPKIEFDRQGGQAK